MKDMDVLAALAGVRLDVEHLVASAEYGSKRDGLKTKATFEAVFAQLKAAGDKAVDALQFDVDFVCAEQFLLKVSLPLIK
jgi:hypothetical protein